MSGSQERKGQLCHGWPAARLGWAELLASRLRGQWRTGWLGPGLITDTPRLLPSTSQTP